MNHHRDHLAPSDLTEDQLEGIKDSDQIRHLREQRLALRDEIRALYGTLKKAKHADPDRYQEHETTIKELARVRAVHRRERKAEFRRDYFEIMPVVEIDKQIDQLLGESPDIHFSRCDQGMESSYTGIPLCGASTHRGCLFRP